MSKSPHRVRTIIHGQTPEVGAVCPNWARTVLCGGRFRFGLRNMPPATTTVVPLQGDHLSRPARRPGCQPNAGPRRLGGGTPRSSGSCAPQSRAQPFFCLFYDFIASSARRRTSCLTAAPVKRRPRGIGVGDQKQSPVMRGSVRLRIQHTSHRHQPITSSPGHGARCPRLGDLATIRVTIG